MYNKLIGFNLTEEQMVSYFPALELKYDADNIRQLSVPTFRQDLDWYVQILLKKWQDFTDMLTFLQHFQVERQQQVKLSYQIKNR